MSEIENNLITRVRKAEADREKLLDALEIFVNAYDFKANEIPDSDLYPEQPKHVTVTLGDLEKSRRIIREVRGI